MNFDQLFKPDAVYMLPDRTLVVARWRGESWCFEYFSDGTPALEVFADGMISQADPPHGDSKIAMIRYTRSDLTIDDIRPV